MSLHREDTRSLDTDSEGLDVVSTKPKVSYSREFLLSLSNLDSGKKLPSGFNESLISELEDALVRVPDRPRIPGSLPLQGIRRNDYSSSPPARGDGSSYSRGIYGKWENRSSGRSDRDSDSQSDRDSDAGRRYGHQPRRSWQSPEHDGLLGSGSFPRPSGYAAGVSAPKVRANEPNQLSRTNEPYQPPRPYKAVPHSRRDTDAFNDETFGSLENTSEDRAEEERKRRASFEIMRKEQHKALQEKQKEKHRPSGVSELADVLGDSKEENGIPIRNHSASAGIPILSNDLEKSSSVSHSPASRPLIPPGFKSSTLEKSPVMKSLTHPPLSELGKSVAGESLVDANGNLVQSTNYGLEKQPSQDVSVVDGPADKTQHTRLLYKGEDVNVHAGLNLPIMKPGVEDQLLRVSGHLVSHGNLDDPDIAGLNLEDKTIRDSNISYPSSLLGRIFGSTLPVSDAHSSSTEHHDGKPDDTWSPGSVHSSKFAQWFSEEEPKAASAISSARPNNLLSLIVGGGDKANGTPDEVYMNNKEDAPPSVLTCEDLEQSILSEYSTKTTNVQPVLKSWSANTELPSAYVGDRAPLNLLSMLQKSKEQSNTTSDSTVDVNLNDKHLLSRQHEIANIIPQREEKGKNLPDAGNSLTLETLFGTAFMKELQSVEAPVSAQRGSTGSAQADAADPRGLPFPVTDHDISSPTIDKSRLQRPSHDYSISTNHRHHTKTSEAENWLGFNDPRINRSSSGPKQVFERVPDFQLPEEDNLLSVGDTLDRQMFTGNSTTKASLPPNSAINMTEKMTALGAVLKDKLGLEGSESFPFRDAYEQMDPRNLQVQQSSPLFQPPPMSQVMPPLYHHHMEPHSAHMSSQMKFLGPDPVFNHDSPANHQFPSNVIQPSFHPNVRVSGFDVPSQHSILHQMQIQGNHPPHLQRGGPISHNGNQAIQGMNQMQGFSSGLRQQNIGGRGVPMPGNPPEAFQRLVEMELRANSKQIHPFAPGHGQGVDMGFRYR